MTREGGIFPLESSPWKNQEAFPLLYTNVDEDLTEASVRFQMLREQSRSSIWSARMYVGESLISSSSIFPALYIGKLVLPLGLQGEKRNWDCLVGVVRGGRD